MDCSKMKILELRRELRSRGLNTFGQKPQLVERLQAAMKQKSNDDLIEADSVGDLDEDLLNDEDDEHIEGSDSVLNDLDTLDTTEPSPMKTTAPKRRSDEITSANGTTHKRIVLDQPAAVENQEEIDDPASGEKKVVKLSELSAKERLEMRAKKFGLPLSADARKEVRAERFGLSENTAKSSQKQSSASIGTSSPASADVLKQRAERFGVTVSTTLTKLEQEDRLERRKQRFGETKSSDVAAKAQSRLERFKQS